MMGGIVGEAGLAGSNSVYFEGRHRTGDSQARVHRYRARLLAGLWGCGGRISNYLFRALLLYIVDHILYAGPYLLP